MQMSLITEEMKHRKQWWKKKQRQVKHAQKHGHTKSGVTCNLQRY